MPIPFLSGLNNPVDRIQPLKPVVLIPVPSGPFDQQLGDLTDVGRPFELTELRVAASDAVRAGAFHLAGPTLFIKRAIGAIGTFAHSQKILLMGEALLGGPDDEIRLVDLGVGQPSDAWIDPAVHRKGGHCPASTVAGTVPIRP